MYSKPKLVVLHETGSFGERCLILGEKMGQVIIFQSPAKSGDSEIMMLYFVTTSFSVFK